jgi:hypothetical protein
MKPATEALPGLVLATRPLAQRDMPYRLVGVLLVVGVPVLFWTSLAAIVSRALAIDIGPTGLISCALVVGVVSFVAAAAVISGRMGDTPR